MATIGYLRMDDLVAEQYTGPATLGTAVAATAVENKRKKSQRATKAAISAWTSQKQDEGRKQIQRFAGAR